MIYGIDISHYQGSFNFAKAHADGKVFSISKATEGVGVTDSQFKRSRIEAPKAGLLFGAYHFFHPAQDLDTQVKHFTDVVGKLHPGELPCSLDWETTDGNKVSRGVQKDRALKFAQEVERISGKTPFVYGSAHWFEQFGDLSAFAHFPLWVAHYGVPAGHPFLPKPFPRWTIHQYADSGGLDLNVFNGSMDQLIKFTA